VVYGRIADFVVGLALVKLHCHWRGNWSGLIQSEHRQNRGNVAVLMHVDRLMLSIVFNVHATIDDDTSEIMHPDPLLHLILDLPNQVLVSNGKEIINVQNDCSNDYAVILLVIEHTQSLVNVLCHELNRQHEVFQSAVPTM
jgi:hypothetical protein